MEMIITEQHSGFQKISLIGKLDESLSEVIKAHTNKLGNKLIFDFRYIEDINSLGVLYWIRFLDTLDSNSEIIYEMCTHAIVTTILLVPAFKGKAKIVSAVGNYFCPECHHEKEHVFIDKVDMPQSPDDRPPQFSCDQCGCDRMEMFELEEEYFSFNYAV